MEIELEAAVSSSPPEVASKNSELTSRWLSSWQVWTNSDRHQYVNLERYFLFGSILRRQSILFGVIGW